MDVDPVHQSRLDSVAEVVEAVNHAIVDALQVQKNDPQAKGIVGVALARIVKASIQESDEFMLGFYIEMGRK